MISLLKTLDQKLMQWIQHLSLVMVVVMFAIVVMRYGFNTGWIAMQESVIYLNAVFVMLGMAYTYGVDGHVRVDIFYNKRDAKGKAKIDLLTIGIFLLPFMLFWLWVSWDYVAAAWHILEASPDAGGIPAVFLLKSLILVLPVLMILQSIVKAIEAIQVIQGRAV